MAWAEVVCSKNTECGVDDEDALLSCREAELEACRFGAEAEAESCRASRMDAVERCTAAFEAWTCADYCSPQGNCFYDCFYDCPAS